mmetsp:Transcript_23017/g.66727  ORF Transcript_23017/g.66727 Transcript_23017/m.66727 type:complete len:404 (-) Transcript_23017:104-1315(-)
MGMMAIRIVAAAAFALSRIDVVVARVFQPGVGPAKGRPLKEQFPWYHTAREIHERLGELADGCRGARLHLGQRSRVNGDTGEVVRLDVVHISRRGASPMTRAMLVFGAHARELITPESALHLVEALCGAGPAAARADGVLDDVAFTIVPIANPLSRRKVEEGQYCLRTNEDGVDLNRNFGNKHRDVDSEEKRGDDTYPGPHGFSEPESLILRRLIDEERPEIYVSVHAGAYLLGTPFGYTRKRLPENERSINEILGSISQTYCAGQCPHGRLARVIHYDSPGCDMDYVAETLGTPYAFLWEIYTGASLRDEYIEEARRQNSRDADPDSSDSDMSLVAMTARRRLLRSESRASAGDPSDDTEIEICVEQFNPPTAREAREVLRRWTGAYLELCEQVVLRRTAEA